MAAGQSQQMRAWTVA